MNDDPTTISSWISFMSNKVKTHGGINLAQGLPGFSPPEKLLSLLAEEALGRNHQYAPGRGVPSLLDHIAAYLQQPPEAAAGNILVTCGATESITLIYQHLARKKGAAFTVAAFGPTYESYTRLPALLGHRFIELSWEPDGSVDLQKTATLLEHEKVDLLIIGSPGNPWGRLLTKPETGFFCRLAAETPLRIIFDMVYSELWFDKPTVFPDPVIRDQVYVVGSFSKMFSVTGWRVGWLVASAGELREISLLHDFTGLSAPHPLQTALSRFMDDREAVADYITRIRQKIKQSCRMLEEAAGQIGFGVVHAGGGYFVWAGLPDGYSDSGRFVLDLYEATGVASVPGIHFGNRFGRYIRFNGARPVGEIEEAVTRIRQFLKK